MPSTLTGRPNILYSLCAQTILKVQIGMTVTTHPIPTLLQNGLTNHMNTKVGYSGECRFQVSDNQIPLHNFTKLLKGSSVLFYNGLKVFKWECIVFNEKQILTHTTLANL